MNATQIGMVGKSSHFETQTQMTHSFADIMWELSGDHDPALPPDPQLRAPQQCNERLAWNGVKQVECLYCGSTSTSTSPFPIYMMPFWFLSRLA